MNHPLHRVKYAVIVTGLGLSLLALFAVIYEKASIFGAYSGIAEGVVVVDAWGAGKWFLIAFGLALLWASVYLILKVARELFPFAWNEGLNIFRRNAILGT